MSYRFNPRFLETITMITRSGDAYIDGRFVKGTEKRKDIEASVQRLSMRERQLLPEGFRASESFKIFTQFDPIQVIENDRDRVIDSVEFQIGDKFYAMLSSERWEYLIDHWKTTVVAKNQGN